MVIALRTNKITQMIGVRFVIPIQMDSRTELYEVNFVFFCRNVEFLGYAGNRRNLIGLVGLRDWTLNNIEFL